MADRSRTMPLQKATNAVFLGLFRLLRGRLSYRGTPIVVLHTVGRRSGQPRRTMLLGIPVDDGGIALVGSNGGDDRTPAWVHNLVAHPEVEVETGGRRVAMRAEVVDDARRAELWPAVTRAYPQYERYQTKTDRPIPVIVCHPT